MTVCIIGGSGFIGSCLTKDLHTRGEKIRVIDISSPRAASVGLDVEYRQADVRDVASLIPAMGCCEAVVNLAAVHRDDVKPRRLYDEVNVEGARNVCEAAEANGIGTIVFTSSVAVYGSAPENADEAQPHQPSNDYGRTKSEAEQVYIAWQRRDPEARCLVIVRPTVVFGPGNRGNVYTLISQVAAGRFLMVGSGKNRKSMAYVDNVSSFIVHLLRSGPGTHIYNYVDKPDLSMGELVAIVRSALAMKPGVPIRVPYWLAVALGCCCDAFAALTRKLLPVSRIRVEKFCANTVFSAEKAIRQARFVPGVSLEAGLKRTIVADFDLSSG
ncbi:MAG: UDP-N-acetylglucosamine 4-epimerase [Rhodospirillum sp.]|nr:UDP-N-acetylglucosamine 4-epimerase [Rhodospirillum sp.]